MFKTSILAVTAVAAIALAIPAAFIATSAFADSSVSIDVSGSSSSAPSTPPSSTPPSEPGGPGGGDGGDLPTPPPEEKIAQLEETCNAALSALVKIPVPMVESFQGGVNVVPVCNSGLGHKASIDNAQALPLQNAIAGNNQLSGPLAQRGFKADNVVGVVLIDGVATLYVHTAG